MVAHRRLELGAQLGRLLAPEAPLDLALEIKEEVKPSTQLSLAGMHPLNLELGLLGVVTNHLAGQHRGGLAATRIVLGAGLEGLALAEVALGLVPQIVGHRLHLAAIKELER